MSRIKITGGNYLTGEINISAAKNAVVALIPAAILCDETVKISNVPNISDVDSLKKILIYLNAKIEKNSDFMEIDASNIINKNISEDLSSKLRASYYFMGALLGKYKKVEMYFPGGCNIGKRPINLHLKGFEALGAKISENNNDFIIEAEELIGNKIYLDIPSVGATINIMLAAVKAKGETIIENAAREPEIVSIATFLNSMGAKIKGSGTGVIKIEGVNYLNSCFHEIIPDRIEAGTYVIIGSLLGKNLTIKNLIPSHIEALTSKLKEAGVHMEIGTDYISFKEPASNYKNINIQTMYYPGFATDLQQPLVPLLTQCAGVSTVEENLFENRFQNIPEINKMGANINVFNNKVAVIRGKTPLIGCEVSATDLRGGMSMIISGLIAEGTTTVNEIEHILRGYDNIVEKLRNVGAKIELD